MPEYAGRVQSQGVDWYGALSKTGQKYDEAIKAREARRAEADKMMTDIQSKVDSRESLANQTLDQMIGRGADEIRNYINQANKDLKSGAIKPSEYKEIMNNINANWDALAYSAKTYDQRVMAAVERQQPGENGAPPAASGFEMYSTKQAIDLKNAADKKIVTGPNGEIYMASTTNPDQSYRLRDLANLDNIVDNRVDVSGAVSEVVSKWDPVTIQSLSGFGGTKTIEDVRQNPAYKSAKYDLVNSIIDRNNPRGVVSVLVDNSDMDYNFYSTPQEMNTLIDEAIRKKESIDGPMSNEQKTEFAKNFADNNLIRVERDANGVLQPVVTDELIKAAEKVVEDQIEIQLGFSKTAEAGWKPESGGGASGASGGSGDDDQAMIAGYKASLEAFGIDTEKVKEGKIVSTNNRSFTGLSRSYQYKKMPDGSVAVYKAGDLDAEGNPVMKMEGFDQKPAAPIFTAKKPKDLAQFVYGGQDIAKDQMKWEKARKMYIGDAKPSPTNSKPKNKFNG